MPTKNVTALIVDDDRAIQKFLADSLSREGFSVLVEKDGEWALKTFQNRPVSVVLLDILLPAVNGYEVARKLRLTPKGRKIPIIFMSGIYRAPAQQKEAVERYSAAGFLEKPFKLAALRESLKKALGDEYPDPKAAEQERERVEHTDPGLFADEGATAEASEVERESKKVAGVSSLRGNLADKPIAEILAEIYRWRSNGALLLRREKVKKIVYFREGQPYFVKSNLLSECLGQILVKEKMISEAECEESIRRMKSSRRQQGTVLIEMGCISPPNLNYSLTIQLQSKLFDVFSWPEGDFQFNSKAELPPETTSLEMTCAAAIYEGIKRTQDLDQINALMAAHQGNYVWPSEDPLYRFQDAGLDDEELALLNACDGRKTVKTLAAVAILTPIETLRLLLSMHYAQMIEFRSEPATAAERASFFPWESSPGVLKTALEELPDGTILPPAGDGIPAVTHPIALQDASSAEDEPTKMAGDAPWMREPSQEESTQVDTAAYVPASVPEAPTAEASMPHRTVDSTAALFDSSSGESPVPVVLSRAAATEAMIPQAEIPAAPIPELENASDSPAPKTKVAKRGKKSKARPPPPPPSSDPAIKSLPARLPAEEKRAHAAEMLEPQAPPPAPPPAIRASPPPPPPAAAYSAGPPPLPKRPPNLPPAPPFVPSFRPIFARAAGSLLPELSGILSPAMTAEERSVREQLAGVAMSMKKQDYFQILRVPPNASADQIRQGYFALAKEFHPDRHFRSASAEIRNLANEIYQVISRAYETLHDPEERNRYVADLAKGIKKDVSEEVSKIVAAEGKFQRGEDLLRKKQFVEAHAAFQEAVDLYGDEGEFRAFLGWSLFQTDPRSPEVSQQAMDEIEKAIRLNPKVDKSYLFLGYIFKAMGRPDKAERQFEKAIQCNPDCTDALRELRLLGRGKK